MRNVRRAACYPAFLSVAVLATAVCPAANAAVTVLGVQYQEDRQFPEYECIWHDRLYPGPCGTAVKGANVHVFLKNTGGSSVTVSDVTLAGYSLSDSIRERDVDDKNHPFSIYYANLSSSDLQALVNAGEPVWYKADPATIPGGGVAQVVVRLRFLPVTQPVSIGVVTNSGTVSASIPVDATAPRLASVGFSPDLKKVTLHWRRSGGAAPTTVWMDGVNVTANTTTVGDSTVDFGASVISLTTSLPAMSYHVFQGVYADGKTAGGSLRAWVNPFLYGTWAAKPTVTIDDGKNWVNEATAHGVNVCVMNVASEGLGDLVATPDGRQYCQDRGYGFVKDSRDGASILLRMWFIRDEPDGADGNMPGLPPGAGHNEGVLAMAELQQGESLRAADPLTPTTVNIDGNLKPYNYWNWGQVPDVFMTDPYYQPLLSNAYWNNPERIPLYADATYIYATAQTAGLACEPNPLHVILYSNKQNQDGNTWAFPTPESKRIEVYYSLAGGAKGMAYWWYKAPDGIAAGGSQAQALWREIGLLGNEIKTAQPLLVTSHPVSLTTTATTGVWVRSLAVGTDTAILLVVNDNYYNDATACHYTPVANATVTATLPTWLRSSTPTAFEISASGLSNVTTQLNGSQLQLSLGTVNLTRMIVVTTNPQLRATIQQRYDEKVCAGVCAMASDLCSHNAPSITLQPAGQTADPAGSAVITLAATGGCPLSFQWQKNQVNLTDGGHYSGCTMSALAIANCDSNDVANYRCVVTNPYGTATSSAATLTLCTACPPIITQQPSSQSVNNGGTAAFGVTATGTAPLSYQWQKNQANLTNGGHYSGATTATLTITSADNGDQATYRCVVTNPASSVNSNPATLTVVTCTSPTLLNGGFEGGSTSGLATSWTGYSRAEIPSTISYTIQTASPAEGLQYQQIQTSYVASGGAGVYQVVTGCTSGITYTIAGSFRTNSANGRATVKCAPNGSTSYSSAFDLTPAATTTSSTWVSFSGTVTATSSSITLFLDSQTYVSGSAAKVAAFDGLTVTGCSTPAGPTITQQPSAQSVCASGTAAFSVTATGDAPLSYQWQKNSVNVTNGGHYSGATTAALTVSSADAGDATSYRCVVTNGGGSLNSNAAGLTLKAATAIGQHPQAQSMSAGNTATFTVAATGNGTLSYQWQKNSLNVTNGGHYAGCTTASLIVSSADSSDAANYRCVVTAGCGSITSNQAALTVSSPSVPGDFDHDGDVDQADFGHLQDCLGPAKVPPSDPNCADANLDSDPFGAVTQEDVLVFLRCMTGSGVAGNPNCAN